MKDIIKQARRAQSRLEGPQPRSRGPEGPLDSYCLHNTNVKSTMNININRDSELRKGVYTIFSWQTGKSQAEAFECDVKGTFS